MRQVPIFFKYSKKPKQYFYRRTLIDFEVFMSTILEILCYFELYCLYKITISQLQLMCKHSTHCSNKQKTIIQRRFCIFSCCKIAVE